MRGCTHHVTDPQIFNFQFKDHNPGRLPPEYCSSSTTGCACMYFAFLNTYPLQMSLGGWCVGFCLAPGQSWMIQTAVLMSAPLSATLHNECRVPKWCPLSGCAHDELHPKDVLSLLSWMDHSNQKTQENLSMKNVLQGGGEELWFEGVHCSKAFSKSSRGNIKKKPRLKL